MGFWLSTLSSAVGAFVGILGAFIIAKWQMNKSHKMNNIQYYMQFNNAQIYIDRFERRVNKILEYTETERHHGRILLNNHDFLDLRNNLSLAIKEVNKDIETVNFDNFVEELSVYNKYAPLTFYKELNFLFFSMAKIYNLLLFDCRYMVSDLPEKIEIPFSKGLTIHFMLKKFRRRYKKMQRRLKI
ncbi:hypothetical protein [Oceanobacillus oncorhynchi]|uniref:hypothetical protein n=1 Tax=Oceanobacillus oncorhynchi TaxID=545501 RepID=UPI001866CC75|nr:hypothetical protein [Oceanobacillus oncorhynchi]